MPTIQYDQPSEFYGRNGLGKMTGLMLERAGDCIELSPITSKGIPGRASLQIPCTMIPAVIAELVRLSVGGKATVTVLGEWRNLKAAHPASRSRSSTTTTRRDNDLDECPFLDYLNEVDSLLESQYGITSQDAGMELIASCQETNTSPAACVEELAHKYNLEPIR